VINPDDISWLLNDKRGRRLAMEIMTMGGMFSENGSEPFPAGRRSLAVQLFNEFRHIEPSALASAISEELNAEAHAADERRIARKRRRAKGSRSGSDYGTDDDEDDDEDEDEDY